MVKTKPRNEKEILNQWVDDMEFQRDAEEFARTGRYDNHVRKAQILADHYRKFSPEGSQPLVDPEGSPMHNPGYIGTIFSKVYTGVSERLEAHKSK
jgi:hypothetical protein